MARLAMTPSMVEPASTNDGGDGKDRLNGGDGDDFSMVGPVTTSMVGTAMTSSMGIPPCR